MNKSININVSQARLIRFIGDPILHHPGILFPSDATKQELKELFNQINQATDALIEEGGAGIAANQCAAIKLPYRFAMVGVFLDNEKHVAAVTKRYP